MRWLAAIFALGLFSALTGGAYLASATGWGLPGMLDQPVSVRQQSVNQTRRAGGPMFLYFGSTRRHFGGGFRGGK